MSHAPDLLLLDPHSPRRRPTVEIVVPVHDEQAILETSVRRLHDYLTERFPLDWVVTIADNASHDRTWDVACDLADRLDGVQAVRLERKGRGRALRATWSASAARVVAYMDVDLSTDLDALLPLVAPLVSGHSDVAIGTRLAPASRVVRGPKREAISRCYNLLLRNVLRAGFSDAQCGFKAVRADTARALLPLVEDDTWFFDTELLVVAEHNGLRIHEVPVDWVDDPDSRVDVVRTATDDLRGVVRVLGRIWRGQATIEASPSTPSALTHRQPQTHPQPVARDGLAGQLVRFASIGVVSTVVFGLLFALLRPEVGPVAAVLASMAVCTVANTAANRRLTFTLATGSRAAAPAAAPGHRRGVGAGVVLGVIPLVLSLAALGLLGAVGISALWPELLAVTLANASGALLRFVVLRWWAQGFTGVGDLPVARLARYGCVSLVATLTSAVVLAGLVSTDALAPGRANVVATLAGVIPSFELNRRWVWERRGRRSLLADVVPFSAMALTGLVLSTLAVAGAATIADEHAVDHAARTAIVLAANLATFGSLWIAQYVLLDRVLFRRAPRPARPA
jgi:putative flippase GtrA